MRSTEYTIRTEDSTFIIVGTTKPEQPEIVITVINNVTKESLGIVLTCDDADVLHSMLSRARQAAWNEFYNNQQKGNTATYTISPPRNYA